jgi:hypothetical protein
MRYLSENQIYLNFVIKEKLKINNSRGHVNQSTDKKRGMELVDSS